MFKLFFSLALIAGANATSVAAADLNPFNWLASRSAPPCSVKPGVRSSRSDLVEFGGISASISAQSTRDESNGCEQTASVWVTKSGVSMQVNLPDADTNTFSIIDFAPDASLILLHKTKTFALPGEDSGDEISLLSPESSALRWVSTRQLIGLGNCSTLVEPEGFLGPRQLVFLTSPSVVAPKGLPSCADRPKLLALDLATRKVFEPPPAISMIKNGHRLGGPLLSCQTDPDLAGACYSIRGRVGLGSNGISMRLWQVGTEKVMNLGEGMLPDELSSLVTPETRVYANMIVCPLASNIPRVMPTVCIESASNLQREKVTTRQAAVKPPAKAGATDQGASH
jgi:hypothetical protein